MKINKRLSISAVAFICLAVGCMAQQDTGKLEIGYKAWSQQAAALWTMEQQYNRAMTSNLPPETKQNLRDEVWPGIEDAYECLHIWKTALDAGEVEVDYNSEIDRLIDEVKDGLPEGGD